MGQILLLSSRIEDGRGEGKGEGEGREKERNCSVFLPLCFPIGDSPAVKAAFGSPEACLELPSLFALVLAIAITPWRASPRPAFLILTRTGAGTVLCVPFSARLSHRAGEGAETCLREWASRQSALLENKGCCT